MAAVTFLGSLWNTTNGGKQVILTPAVNDCIVIITSHDNCATLQTPFDDEGGAGAGVYTRIGSAVKPGTGSGDELQAFVRQTLIPTAVPYNFTHLAGATTGGGLHVIAVSGMSRAALTGAIRQFNAVSTQLLNTTPTLVMPAAALTTNPVFAVAFNDSIPVGTTTPTGFTTLANPSFSGPNTGIHIVARSSGHTSATVAYGSNSPTGYCAMAFELDASAAATSIAPILASQYRRRRTH